MIARQHTQSPVHFAGPALSLRTAITSNLLAAGVSLIEAQTSVAPDYSGLVQITIVPHSTPSDPPEKVGECRADAFDACALAARAVISSTPSNSLKII
jgi:hypothetical protein